MREVLPKRKSLYIYILTYNVQILELRQFVQIIKLLKSYPRLLRKIKVHVLTFKVQILDLLQRVQVVVHKVLKNLFIDA